MITARTKEGRFQTNTRRRKYQQQTNSVVNWSTGHASGSVSSSYTLGMYTSLQIDEACSKAGMERVWEAGGGRGGFDNLEGEEEEDDERERFVYVYRKV